MKRPQARGAASIPSRAQSPREASPECGLYLSRSLSSRLSTTIPQSLALCYSHQNACSGVKSPHFVDTSVLRMPQDQKTKSSPFYLG